MRATTKDQFLMGKKIEHCIIPHMIIGFLKNVLLLFFYFMFLTKKDQLLSV